MILWEDGKQFVCMKPDDIINKQQQAIKAVNNVLPALPVTSVRVLLQKFNVRTTL